MTIDIKINKKYYDHFPNSDSITEDRIKLWWKKAIKSTFRHVNLNGKDILEIGAGKGILEWLFPLNPQKIVFTEISTNRIQKNSYKYLFNKIDSAVINDANYHCFKTNSFDVILFVNVLMMIHDKEKLIQEYKTLLKKGGVIVVIDVLNNNPFYKLNKKLSKKYNKISVQNITPAECINIAKKYSLLEEKYCFFFSILTASLLIKYSTLYVNKIHKYIVDLDTWLMKKYPILRKYAVLYCMVLQN